MVNKAAVRSEGKLAGDKLPSVPARPRRRGRPRRGESGSENVRERLLTAALDLFVRYGYRAVSSRQIGAAAGVNFAMIRYYFGGKPGLYCEILNHLLTPVYERLKAAVLEPVPLPQLIKNVMVVWAGNPWLAGFVVREVLTPDGPMRARFSREFPERFVPVAEEVVRGAIARGELRADVDPRLLVLSMVSLGIFPFLAFPVTSRILDVSRDEQFVERLARHTADLFLRGVGPEPDRGARAPGR